jgi:hypothetical protein
VFALNGLACLRKHFFDQPSWPHAGQCAGTDQMCNINLRRQCLAGSRHRLPPIATSMKANHGQHLAI